MRGKWKNKIKDGAGEAEIVEEEVEEVIPEEEDMEEVEEVIPEEVNFQTMFPKLLMDLHSLTLVMVLELNTIHPLNIPHAVAPLTIGIPVIGAISLI